MILDSGCYFIFILEKYLKCSLGFTKLDKD